ncbi:Inner membrane protein YihY, formerly thought tobe RNase BN [Natrarchaeobaculum sulfurireducens]|uniref:Inner membrane protein YihY, formerly thought tobe RNase BN n=1 Tax=Natrarchaeobaculum sulfurireducens TaxID=2044521 RepID=A0A346PM32_9EURY|nr:Ribonuclease BN family enzyme [Natrarchaeobaculum sulfurireducens]AXR80577.1 Inner membrane protein YihY, formerly thought tobe RNase BN [Natrarchaeobaculum sulfurireducens]
MVEYRAFLEFATRVVALARTEQLTLLAAAVAFYGFISLVPLVLLAVGIAASIGGDALADQLTAAAGDVLTPAAQELLADTVLDDAGRQSATVAGALGLLWGSSRVLRGIDRAFSRVYGTVASKTLLDTIWDAMIAFLAISFGLAIVGGLEVVIRFLPVIELGFFGPLFVLLGLVVTFLPLYVIFPDDNVGLREALPGTIIAAVGWFALSRTFSIYATFAAENAVYGALGAVFLVLIWLYAGAIVLLSGAVCNAVLANREVDRQLQSPGARQFFPEAMTDDATGADEGDATDRSDADDGRARSADARTRSSARTRDRADDPEALREEIERLRDRVDSFEDSVERRTVQKASLEDELRRYVRRRVRRGHARGWGPYLVLLYGTVLALGAFYFLEGWAAIVAMLVVWTSVLGVYLLMVLFGAGMALLDVPGKLRDAIGDRRS